MTITWAFCPECKFAVISNDAEDGAPDLWREIILSGIRYEKYNSYDTIEIDPIWTKVIDEYYLNPAYNTTMPLSTYLKMIDGR